MLLYEATSKFGVRGRISEKLGSVEYFKRDVSRNNSACQCSTLHNLFHNELSQLDNANELLSLAPFV